MKDGAWVVNTSRAQIIENNALLAELRRGRINAALDVYETEPLPQDDELQRLSNVVLSPHTGYVSRDTYDLFYNQTYQALTAWLNDDPVNVIT